MTDIKTNLRDGAYVALGAAALGVQHLSKKRDEIKIHFNTMSAKFEPVLKEVAPHIKEASDRVSGTLSPLTTKISPVTNRVIPTANSMANKVSTNISPVANNVAAQMKTYAQAAYCSSKKIADEAKRRVS